MGSAQSLGSTDQPIGRMPGSALTLSVVEDKSPPGHGTTWAPCR